MSFEHGWAWGWNTRRRGIVVGQEWVLTGSVLRAWGAAMLRPYTEVATPTTEMTASLAVADRKNAGRGAGATTELKWGG